MPSMHEQHTAVEHVENILGGQAPAPASASACDATGDDLPEFLQALDKQVLYGTAC